MSKRIAVPLALSLAVLVATASLAAGPSSGPDPASQQTIAKLRSQLRNARLNNADLQDQVDALNAVNGDQADQIVRLQNRIANWPDPLDVITSRGPDGLWNAMRSIWLEFPNYVELGSCGYDRDSAPGDGVGLTLTSFTFYRWSGC